MCIEEFKRKERLGKPRAFAKVVQVRVVNGKVELLGIKGGRVFDANGQLVRTRKNYRTGDLGFEDKKPRVFAKRRSFQVFLDTYTAEKFAQAMNKSRKNYIVVAVEAPRGALIWTGIIYGAAKVVNGQPGARISSGKLIDG